MSGYFQKIDELERINKQESELGALKTKLAAPMLTDTSHIPMIIKWISEISPYCRKSGKDNSDFKKMAILIILYLYSPISLVRGKFETGYREIIAKELEYSSSSAVSNHLKSDLIFQYKKIPDFKERVETTYAEIIKRLKEKQLIS